MVSLASSRSGKEAYSHRLRRMRSDGLKPPIRTGDPGKTGVVLECGWGRLLFAQTFDDPRKLVDHIRDEATGRRDMAIYVRDPHVLLASAPQELFLDPSHMYRLDLATFESRRRPPGSFRIRRLIASDGPEVNRIYAMRQMVPVPAGFLWLSRSNRAITYFVAEDPATGRVIGTVTGIDHKRAFNDPEQGASLWCLAVDPQAVQPGVGEALVRHLAGHFKARGAAYMDLSVLHDNAQAIALYEKLDFRRVPFFTVKRKNSINERLFTGDLEDQALNPYARIIVKEARRRGIQVEVTDAEGGFFRLSHGGRSVHCRESLSELTSGVAVSICDDKAVTRRVVERAGVTVPAQMEAGDREALAAFVKQHGSVVVKPARGEQGRGVAVGLESIEDIEGAIATARTISDRVLIEQCAPGEDLRLVIIDYRLVAAATRRPARVFGDGQSTIRTLIERQSRRRAAATGGESRIPLDEETERCVRLAGFGLDDVPPAGLEVPVRKTANLHTGGTINDVTDQVHPALVEAAIAAARAIGIPVAGIDFMVRSPDQPEYVFIEANERPGLANHEPQPTAERFIDLLFPQSIPSRSRGRLRAH